MTHENQRSIGIFIVFLHVVPFKLSRFPAVDSKAIRIEAVCTWWSGGHFQSGLSVVGSCSREVTGLALGLKRVHHLEPICISGIVSWNIFCASESDAEE